MEPNISQLVERLPVPVIIFDDNWIIRSINPVLEKLSGYSMADERSMKAWLSRVFPDPVYRRKMQYRWFKQINRVKTGKNFQSFEARFACENGQEFHMEYHQSIVGGYHMGVFFDLTQIRRNEEIIRNLVEASSSRSGEAFFDSMTMELTKALNADFALIGRLLQKDPYCAIHTIAVVADGQKVPDFKYTLEDTPCEEVMKTGVCSYPSRVAELFPKNTLLKEMGVEAYVGIPLFTSSGSALGIMVAMYRSPLTDTKFAESILSVFAGKVGGEIERMDAQEELQKRVSELQRWHQLTLDREGRVHDLKMEVNELLKRLNEDPKYGE